MWQLMSELAWVLAVVLSDAWQESHGAVLSFRLLERGDSSTDRSWQGRLLTLKRTAMLLVMVLMLAHRPCPVAALLVNA